MNASKIQKEALDTISSQLDQLIAVMTNTRIKARPSIDQTLWDTQEIADYIGISYKYTHEHIVYHHTFPDAMRINLGGSKKGHPRWYAGEVMKWVEGFRTVH